MANETLVKGLIIAGVASIGIAATTKGASLKRLGDELVITTDTKAEVRNKRMTITARVKLKNPTGESIGLFHPFVRVQFEENGDPFTSSDPKPKQYLLEPHDTLELEPIVLEVGIFDLVRAVPKLVNQIKEKNGLDVYVRYIINITGRSIPMDKMDVYSLRFSSFEDLLNAIAS